LSKYGPWTVPEWARFRVWPNSADNELNKKLGNRALSHPV
jgi:hypothetical protein